MRQASRKIPANDVVNTVSEALSPISHEIVIGVVGYAGAGCSTAIKRLRIFLEDQYEVYPIKLSDLIVKKFSDRDIVVLEEGRRSGESKLRRAGQLQDFGDELRKNYGGFAVASLATAEIIRLRGDRSVGEKRIVYILDSIKHPEEVDFLRQVYGESFRLIAVHCEKAQREKRLIGSATSSAKYAGVNTDSVKKYMERDEKDAGNKTGQQVRESFYLADYFLENNTSGSDGANLNGDIERFVNLLLGSALVRPTSNERAMYHAYAAARQSACLSRQVGAAILAADGTVVATGSNDVPRFGGGVYEELGVPDHRCHVWEWDAGGSVKWIGCHNSRKKNQLRQDIGVWLGEKLSSQLAALAHPTSGMKNDLALEARKTSEDKIRKFFKDNTEYLEDMPAIKDLIEFSRSIHAEMNALFSAARSGFSPVGATLFCTTYPCHNCARHLVTAGISAVYYIEPYVKSLAIELHEDSISTASSLGDQSATKMAVLPFTGVGPRMYEDFFTKRSELKRKDGKFELPSGDEPGYAVRLRELRHVEQKAAAMLSGEA